MKQLLFVLTCVLQAGTVLSQQFQMQRDLMLGDSIQSSNPVWMDIDNDGLLDVLLISHTVSNRNYFQFVKGDTIDTPQLHVNTTAVIAVSACSLIDYNLDNRMDVVVSGMKAGVPTTAVYLNLGGFEFAEKILDVPTFSILKAADLDNDGKAEWILSGLANGTQYLNILKPDGVYTWKVVHDSLEVHATALEIVDASGDGNPDIFLSAERAPDSLVSGFLINQGALFFTPELTSQKGGVSAVGDKNGDGFLDILLMGKGRDGQDFSNLYRSAEGSYSIDMHAVVLRDPHPFMADFNSDGQLDYSYLGTLPSSDTINIIQYGEQDYDTLNHKQLVTQVFGDAEHDGDLDLVQLVQRTALHLLFYENSPAAENAAPKAPKNAVALRVFDRTFLYWDKPVDDHTTVPSLTYDLHLNGEPGLQVGAFDLMLDRRLTVTHGNNGTENFRLLRSIPFGPIGFSVQAIDNAYHAGSQCVCVGYGCVAQQEETLSACTGQAFDLVAPAEALWFSFSKGYLGTSKEFEFQAEEKDTVFYYSPSTGGCSGLKAWTVEINNDTLKTILSDRYACQDSLIALDVEKGWESVQWQSMLRGDLGVSQSIDYKVTQPDSVSVTLTNGLGCTLIRKTAIKLSKPQILLDADSYKILKGSSVQLGASGADTYVWTPPKGLDDAHIASPTASPGVSIQYTVTGYDSLGCEDKRIVNIVVEGAGFIPNLFTPNDDGKNDELRIYGLSNASKFSFSIYNREGILVFKTSDVSEAVQRGWDGTKNGTKQPAGVYFWKVQGEVPSGDRVLLNGKDSGSIVLVR